VVLLFLVAGPVVVVNRDLLFHRSARRRSVDVPLPFLIIPTFPGAADIIPARPPRRAPSPVVFAPPPVAPLPVAPLPVAPPAFAAPVAQPQPRAAAPKPPQARYQPPPARPAEPIAEPAAEPLTEPLTEPFTELFSDRERMFEFAGQADLALETDEDEVDEVDQPDDVAESRKAHESDWSDESEEPSPDATIVFHRPVDEPVQILPGRLQILSGEAAGEDLRLFSRMGEPPQILVGRETGPAHRHITLHSPTVSRRHARMDFANGHWTITNLSATNPVLVNDRVLTNGGSAKRLSDGDRIELGEVALRFVAS
jgi:FHA domain-containing protein